MRNIERERKDKGPSKLLCDLTRISELLHSRLQILYTCTAFAQFPPPHLLTPSNGMISVFIRGRNRRQLCFIRGDMSGRPPLEGLRGPSYGT